VDLYKKRLMGFRQIVIAFFAFLVIPAIGNTQIAENIVIDKMSSALRTCNGQQFAGTFSIGQITGQTNDVSLNRMFLCAGDRIQLRHDGNAIFNGDPDPSTTPGIGYAWYACPPDPAISGADELPTIITDPCIFDLVNTPALGVFIYTDDQNGDAIFRNEAFTQANGMVQTIPEYYNNGDPIEIWFAPITYDRLDAASSQAAYDNFGSCVDVNTDAAFSVVYLNPIEIGNEQTNVGGNELTASFIPTGGLSEFDGTNYTISIYRSNNPAIQATSINGPMNHDGVITYTVPSVGEYTIEISDGKNCSVSSTMFLGADPVIVSVTGCDTISSTNLEPGDTICLPITVENFDSITVASLGVVWDASVLQFINVQNFGSSAIDQSTFGTAFPNGITLVAFNFPISSGETLPDGTILFEVCFRIISTPGSTTSVVISDFQNAALEFANASVGEIPVETTEPCQITVAQTANLSAFLTSCGGGPGDGDITIAAFGGTAPYFYDYINTADGSINGSNISFGGGPNVTFSVPAGNYNIVVRDTDGNTQNYNIDVDAMLLDISSTKFFSPTCYDFTNGNIRVIAENGTPPYSYLITDLNNPQIPPFSGFILTAGDSATVPSLPASNYFVEVTDAHGCTQILNQTLNSNPFVIDIQNQTDATCIGSADGAISINISGSTPFVDGTYRFDFLTNIDLPTNSSGNIGFGALDPGEYCVTIRSSVPGCDTVYCFTIGADVVVSGNILTVDETCAGAMNGAVLIGGVTNGSPVGPYDFSILNANNAIVGSGAQTINFNFSPLDTGAYKVLVEDNAGCMSDTLTFDILPGERIEVTVDTTSFDDCLPVFATGSAVFNITGGTGPYTLDAGAGVQSGDSLLNLNAGDYNLTVTDANGCSSTLPFTIFDYEEAFIGDELINFQIDGTPCAGGTISVVYNGQIPSGPDIGVSWVGLPDNTPTIQITDDGAYSVFIFDTDIHCQLNSDTLIECDDIFGIDITLFQPRCNSAAIPNLMTTGSVLIDTFNAVAPVTYFWSLPDTTIDDGFKDGLAPGWYYITVTDARDSTVVDSFEIIEPAAVAQVFNQADSTSCFNICDGGVTITPINNDNPTDEFILFWDRLGSPSSDTGFVFTVDSLCAGFQSFTVTQDEECFYVDSIDIPAPEPVLVELDTLINISCFGVNDGAIFVEGSGGSPGYTFLWEDNSVASSLTLLSSGTYLVTVTDLNSCSAIDSFEVIEPDSLIVSIDSSASSVLGCNSQLGLITLTVEGGTEDYSYIWNPNVTDSPIAQNLQAGLYQIMVTDANGCTDTTSFNITSPPPIFYALSDFADPPCFGDATLFTVDTAYGGSGTGFSFSIQNGANQAVGTPIPLNAGQYLISISDSTGCTVDTTIQINQPNPLEVQVDPSQVTIDLGTSAQLEAEIIQSDKPIDQYIWTPASLIVCDTCPVTNTDSLISSQVFVLTVVDTSGCIATAEALVEVSTKSNVFIPNIFTPNDDGINEYFSVFTGAGVAGVQSAKIFDRWGELMHSAENLGINGSDGIRIWDGEFNNEPMQPGVYVYLVDVLLINGENLLFRGDVTLIR